MELRGLDEGRRGDRPGDVGAEAVGDVRTEAMPLDTEPVPHRERVSFSG